MVKPGASIQSITHRKMKTIDLDTLRGKLAKSRLCTEEIDNLDELVSCYNSTLSSLMDKHAPLQSRNVNGPRIPWFNEIRDAIKGRRKAERKWRRTKSVSHYLADFKQKKNYATLLMNRARYAYYSEFINENSADQGRLFRATKTLLKELNKLSLPEGSDAQVLANDIGKFFVEKVNNIHAKLTGEEASDTSEELITNTYSGAFFLDFSELSSDDVRTMIMQSSKKSCTLDPMPSSLIVQCIDELLPVITSILNLSLQSGYFAEQWKEALVHPLLKTSGLDLKFQNLRPVSNLPFISKLTESAAANQMQTHMSVNHMYPVFQSAYRKQHSTETALLKVHNDILMNMNKQRVTLLVLLDLCSI